MAETGTQRCPCFFDANRTALTDARDGALLSGGERLAPTEPAGETSNRLSTGHGAQTKK